jgi:nucleoside-diphosphate-sugar epimerase
VPKVLVLGATGCVGKRVTDVLVASGQHRVFGVVRSEDKAKSLSLSEITPILCPDPVAQPAPFLDATRHHRIDVVVDVAGANHGSAEFPKALRTIGEERLKTAGAAGPKLGFVYCSGTWVHGSSPNQINDLDIVGDDAPIKPATLVSWRADLEAAIRASSDVLDVAIVRPALIYGREGTIWTYFMAPLPQAVQKQSTEPVDIALELDSLPGLVHVDDIATAFKCVVEQLPLINNGSVYPVFDLVTSQESMLDIFRAAASVLGYKGQLSLVGAGDNLFAQAMSTTMRGTSARAMQLLHWQPKRLNGMVTDMDIYAAALASQH